MTFKRSYEDGCAAAHALDLVGERWALLIVRELVFGAKRFTDLRVGLPGISPNVLTLRLEELEQAAVLRRRRLLPPAATSVYELTDWGRELAPILLALGRWGVRSPLMAAGLPVSTAALMMSMQAMFDAELADGLSATVGLHLGDEHFHAVVSEEGFSVARGEAESPDVVIGGSTSALAEVIHGVRRFTEALKSAELLIEAGDKALARRFVALFPLPEPVAPAAG
jgi:DNA-binding HxlR family transcriptional regulator/putative sterol carrier protein